LQTLVPETAKSASATGAGGASMSSSTTYAAEVMVSSPTQLDPRAKAKMQDYEGEACGDCGNYTLVRNGTCMKCNTCGATSGCS